MAEIYNEQRVLGVVIVADGTKMYNGLPVIGLREAGTGVKFVNNQRTLGVEIISGGAKIWNDQPVRGAVLISDARTLYNGGRVIPSSGGVEGIGYIGVNLTNLEYAWGQRPTAGVKSFAKSSIRSSFVRLPTAHERWVSGNGLGGALNATYVAAIRAEIAANYALGMSTIIDLHNYGRFDASYDPAGGSPPGTYNHGGPGDADSYVLGSVQYPIASLTNVWNRISATFAGEPGLFGYGIANEPHDLVNQNLLGDGNALNGPGWYGTGAATRVLQGDGYWEITAGAGGYDGVARSITTSAGQKTFFVEVKAVSGTQQFTMQYDYAAQGGVRTATTTPQVFSFTVTTAAAAHDLIVALEGAAGTKIRVRNLGFVDGASVIDVSKTTWQVAAQASADAIRANDAATYLVINGDNYGNAQTWASDNANLSVTDAQNKVVYDAHHYFDAKGTYIPTYDALGMTPTKGAEQAAPFIAFMASKGFKFIIGEIGIPLEEPRYLLVLANTIDAYQASPLCVGICVWNVIQKQAGDPSFYANGGGVAIRPEDVDKSRADLLKSKAKSGMMVSA